mmetsp:Transcript_109048/g.216567  ORF Transcript_109048/g.216567 Transcript_109048/m.216567 type:complete len:151 (-) Transcript_109048:195-647(-)
MPARRRDISIGLARKSVSAITQSALRATAFAKSGASEPVFVPHFIYLTPKHAEVKPADGKECFRPNAAEFGRVWNNSISGVKHIISCGRRFSSILPWWLQCRDMLFQADTGFQQSADSDAGAPSSSTVTTRTRSANPLHCGSAGCGLLLS